MSLVKTTQADYVVIGSGFAGSVLAWILARAGRRVALLDRYRHPRFAIGESSTPLADFLLEQMSDEFNLPELKPLARWGTWQASLPELGAGQKRGFSYYQHRVGEPFTDNASHDRSRLVAASPTDDLSDTHWLRSDVDQWLAKQAVAAGAQLLDNCRVTGVQFDADAALPVRIETVDANGDAHWQCRHVIDASGGGAVLPRLLRLPSLDHRLQTRTAAMFGHFEHVGDMSDWLRSNAMGTDANPFNGDAAAQHHLIENGWVWMLRFQSTGPRRLTSIGIVRDQTAWRMEADEPKSETWRRLISDYPTLQALLAKAKLVAPVAMPGAEPTLGWLPRISRCQSKAAGDRWSLLPSTVGIVDPLHSTGIAHALSGVQRVARSLLRETEQGNYGREVVREIQWIDRLVHAAYLAMRDDTASFHAACNLYFVAAIHCERQLAGSGKLTDGFLMHQNSDLGSALDWFTSELKTLIQHPDRRRRDAMIAQLRQRLTTWDDVGLFDHRLRNRVARAAAPKAPA